jgi:Fe-S cluster assembly ATPase SufC
MSATTDLKKGGARERISFKAEWAWGGDGPLDGSGGQDRREDLALFAAVQDLAESRSARPFPIKVWDEPGDSLDTRGQELFAAWVKAESRRRGTGLLITHSETLAGLIEPDHTWVVVMDKNGATVEVS